MQVTTGMVGSGFYNRNSAPQWAATERVLPWLDEAIAGMPLAEPPAVLRYADFGCSEGRNSLQIAKRVVATLRTRGDRPIQTIHSDLPTNDFTWLLRSFREDGGSVLGSNCYSSVVGGTMYEQLLPPRSLHLATTFNAIGFFSRRPLARLPGYILPNGPSALRGIGSVSEADQAAFSAQALADMESFLRARAAELVPGGRLLVEVFGGNEEVRTSDGIYDVLHDAILEVVEAGLLDRESYETFYQPVYMRDLEELTRPVRTPDSEIAPLFNLERSESYEVPVPFVEDFRQNSDLKAYAKSYTDFYRAFTEPVLRGAFAAADDRLIERIYGRAEQMVCDHPERYPFRYISVAMLLSRTES